MTEQPEQTPETQLAQTVQCPDCWAPAGTPCRSDLAPHHVARYETAVLRAADRGTCALCGHLMVRLTRPDGTVDAWHPIPADAATCPQLPDPAVDWNAYALAVNLGQSAGRPGIEHFRPAEVSSDA